MLHIIYLLNTFIQCYIIHATYITIATYTVYMTGILKLIYTIIWQLKNHKGGYSIRTNIMWCITVIYIWSYYILCILKSVLYYKVANLFQLPHICYRYTQMKYCMLVLFDLPCMKRKQFLERQPKENWLSIFIPMKG